MKRYIQDKLKLWKQFISLKEKNDVLAAKKTIVAHKIRSRMGNALHFDGIAEHILKKDSTGFSESRFRHGKNLLYSGMY